MPQEPGQQCRWSSLDPNLVVAAEDQYGRLVPSRMLFSPEGHTLYAATGAMSESQIRDVLSRYMRDWDSWSRTGEHFDWMMD